MKTYIGKVNCNFELDGELVLYDYSVVVDGISILNLEDDIEYFVDEELDYDINPRIFVSDSHTKINVLTLAPFYDDREGRKVHLPFEAKIVLNKVKAHFNRLSENLKIRNEIKWNEFREEVLKEVSTCQPFHLIRTMIYNFITSNPPSIIYVDNENIHVFENMLYEEFGIGKYLLQTYREQEKLNELYNGLDLNVFKEKTARLPHDEVDGYYFTFMKLIQVIKRRTSISSKEKAVYFTWLIFNEEVCHYYHNVFKDEYSSFFPNVNGLSIEECIRHYSSIDVLNPEQNENISMFTFYLMYLQKFDDNSNFPACYNRVVDKVKEKKKENDLDAFENSLLNPTNSKKLTIEDVDLMSGYEFETFISNLFNKMGYKARVTKSSGDQGIDVLAEKNGKKYGIQTKCYAHNVTNKAIQEVVAGLKYYNLDKGMVVTNSYFTDSARTLAQSNNVLIWDRMILKEKICHININ